VKNQCYRKAMLDVDALTFSMLRIDNETIV